MTNGQLVKVTELNGMLIETTKLLLEVLEMAGQSADAKIVAETERIINATGRINARVKHLTDGE